jgi:non-specific serine/threonine protein kinase
MDTLPVFLSHRFPPLAHEKSLFFRQGDYWVIGYRTAVALLKATRGLQDLALLLGNPGREFHVCELVGRGIGKPLLLGKGERAEHASQDGLLSDVGPILDAQAKDEYKRRLDDLRRDLEEAERFNDTGRAERAREEMGALTEQLAAAVGLGGRNRRIGSGAERARSAVTKRIKSSIKRIGETIPSLGSHLATRVRTGYFCSYSPHPERPVAWKF